MRENGYSEDLIFDFDGFMAELMMYVEGKLNERVERPAPTTPTANTIQVPKYENADKVLEEIEANIQHREEIDEEAISIMSDVESLDKTLERILDGLPVMF